MAPPTLPRRTLFGLLLLMPVAASSRTFAERGVALRGTDGTAYFSEHRLMLGRPEFSTGWDGARWVFS